tara:strand:- start:858 stop:1127 length:270 start_codon:yes stop_codon:yes gene_type:complete
MELTLKNEAKVLSDIIMHLGEKTALVYRGIHVICGHNNILIRNLHKRGLLRLITANDIQCVSPTRDKKELYQFIKDNLGVVYLNYFMEN